MRRPGAHPLLAAVLAAACGCSLVSVVRPPPPPVAPDAKLECTQARTAPVLDTVGAVVVPIAGLGLWGMCSLSNSWQSWASDPQRLNCNAVLLATALSTAAYLGSAVYGYRSTGACRRLAEQRWERAPQPVAVPQVPLGLPAQANREEPPAPAVPSGPETVR